MYIYSILVSFALIGGHSFMHKKIKKMAPTSTHNSNILMEKKVTFMFLTKLWDLMRHLPIHTGERKFICTVEECMHRFKYRSTMKAHARRCRNRIRGDISALGTTMFQFVQPEMIYDRSLFHGTPGTVQYDCLKALQSSDSIKVATWFL